MPYRYTGSLAVVLAAFLWSLDGLLRRQLYSLPPMVVVFWEHVLGLLLLIPVLMFLRRSWRTLTRKQWTAILLVALFSGALGTYFYTSALGKIQYIPFSVVVLLQQLQPVFAISAAALVLREPITKRFAGLAVIGLIAAYFVSFPELRVNLSTGQGTALAALLAVGAAACWGASTAFSKYSLRGTSFVQITAARFGLTPLFALLFLAAFGQTGSLTALTATQWWYVLAITCSTGLVALAIYYFGLQRILASRSTLLELTWPVSAVVIGYLFLGDRLTWTQLVGSLVLIVTMVQVARDAERAHESQLVPPETRIPESVAVEIEGLKSPPFAASTKSLQTSGRTDGSRNVQS